MKEFKFKTNINDEDCLASVTPFLNQEKSIESWQVDVNNQDKILTVSGQEVTSQQVIEAVQKAGYDAEIISGSRLGER